MDMAKRYYDQGAGEAANERRMMAYDEPLAPADEHDYRRDDSRPARKLTRNERMQGMADNGCDTWEEYRGER